MFSYKSDILCIYLLYAQCLLVLGFRNMLISTLIFLPVFYKILGVEEREIVNFLTSQSINSL